MFDWLAVYTLADLTRMTGSKRRTVQLWAEAGAIVAEPGTSREGSGVHRVFDRNEAIIACVLGGFSIQGVTIGKLAAVSGLLRSQLNAPEPVVTSLLEDAVSDQGNNLLIYDSKGNLKFWSDRPILTRLTGGAFNESPSVTAQLFGLLSSLNSISNVVVNLNAAFSAARKELVK